MNKTDSAPFFSAQQPFLWNSRNWKLFLQVHQTTLGPLHRFQGAVMVEGGQEKPCATNPVEEVRCPKHHSNRADATLDAMDLAHVVLVAINAALFADDQPVEVNTHQLLA